MSVYKKLEKLDHEAHREPPSTTISWGSHFVIFTDFLFWFIQWNMSSSTEPIGKTNDSHSSLSSTLCLMLIRHVTQRFCCPTNIINITAFTAFTGLLKTRVHVCGTLFLWPSLCAKAGGKKAGGNYDLTIIGCCSKPSHVRDNPALCQLHISMLALSW